MINLRSKLFTTYISTAFCMQLLSHSFNNMLHVFSKQCTDVMLESLSCASNITALGTKN